MHTCAYTKSCELRMGPDQSRRPGFASSAVTSALVLQENYLFDGHDRPQHRVRRGQPDMDRVTLGRARRQRPRVHRAAAARLRHAGRRARARASPAASASASRSRARSITGPPILILDEATSALDTESERAVKENMDAAARGADVVRDRAPAVAPSATPTASSCSRRGRLVEHGTHDELMARQGLYYYLSSQQLEL